MPIKERIQAVIFCNYYKNTDDPEIEEMVKRIKKTHRLDMFNYDYVDKYDDLSIDIKYDARHKLFYSHHNNHIMYYKKSLNSKRKVTAYYKSLLYDQDIDSPHRYLTEDFSIDGGVVVDAGVAEGSFIIDNLDKASMFIGIECDEEWLKALELTFEKEIEQGKVIIFPQMLGDSASDKMTTIDDLYLRFPGISFVKMDIEGYEQKACKNSLIWLEKSDSDAKMVVCTYHTPEAYDELVEIFGDHFKIETTRRYMILNSIFGKPHGYFTPPYVRRGVIRVSRIKMDG